MIRLQRITTADTDLYSYREKLMTQSIPSEEYRELEELRKYTDTKTHFYNNIIFHNNTPGRSHHLLGFRTFLLYRAFCH